ncbi:MAG: ABC transporter ATP-binding protein [Planctomycetota bacterium]|nr:ABC transporter ATP-binding protein [Planctomycetota bacterium]
MNPILQVRDLSVEIPLTSGILKPVREVCFQVEPGETLAIVGESGCGKSLTSLALMGLLPKAARCTATELQFAGQSLLGLSERTMSNLRGNRMAMIFQDPMTSLNPGYTIGNQLMEVYLRHRKSSRREAHDRSVFLLEKVGITATASRLGQYPHQLSGGLRQRVMVAMGLMCEPELIIADEPTTALDVTIQAQILLLLAELQKEFQMALILITHDLGVVARVADRVAVMYAGQIVETGTGEEVFSSALHPYTQGLLECIPIPGKTPPGTHLGSIPGIVPNLLDDLQGCLFRDRCSYVHSDCALSPTIVSQELRSGRSYRCLLAEDLDVRNSLSAPNTAGGT